MVRRDIKGFCANKHTRTHTNMCVCFIFSSEKTVNHDITSSPCCCSCSISYQSEVLLHLAIFRIFMNLGMKSVPSRRKRCCVAPFLCISPHSSWCFLCVCILRFCVAVFGPSCFPLTPSLPLRLLFFF